MTVVSFAMIADTLVLSAAATIWDRPWTAKQLLLLSGLQVIIALVWP